MGSARGYARRPSGIARINRGSSQARGLLDWFPGEASDRTLNGAAVTWNKSSTDYYFGLWGSQYGVFPLSEYHLPGGLQASITGVSGRVSTTSSFSFCCRHRNMARQYSTFAQVCQLWSLGESNATNWSMVSEWDDVAASSPVIKSAVVTTSGGAARYTTTGSTAGRIVPSEWFDLVVVWDASSCVLTQYINGRADGSVSTAGTTTMRDTDKLWLMGDTQNKGVMGQQIDMRWYPRALSAGEAYAYSDPRTRWDLYWQPSRRTYAFVGAAAPAARANRLALLGAS